MEHHPLLAELLQICSTQNIEPSKAYITFEVYQELSEVRKLAEVDYGFNEVLKIFYLTGKKDPKNEEADVYVPFMVNDTLSPEEMESFQNNLCPNQKQFYLIIRDRDSSSTCYQITRGLVKPDSPAVSKTKKELEAKKYQLDKIIQNNKRMLYSKALKQAKGND